MDRQDFDVFCAALAFTAVAMRSETLIPDAGRVAGLADLIKEFCHATVPEAFADDVEMATRGVGAALNPYEKFGLAERMSAVIVKRMRENDECLPQDVIDDGFTPEEVERHWAMAKALAYVELNITDS